MKPAINPKHKFLVSDYNGFLLFTRASKPSAVKAAREYANRNGIHTYVNYSERWFGGRIHHNVLVRSRNFTKRLALNGQWI